MARTLNKHKRERHAGPVGTKLQTVTGSSSKVSSPDTECAVENVQGGSDKGDDRFGVVTREGKGPPRRRALRLADRHAAKATPTF